jgi:hypothetical protein
MAQVREDKAPEQAGAWEKAEAAVGAGVLPQAPAATVFAPTAAKVHHTNWGRPAMNSNVPSVGPR